MKIIIPIALILLLSSKNCLCQNISAKQSTLDSILITKLKNEKPEDYAGKLLGDFLQNKVLKKYKEWARSTEPPGVLHSIILSYSKEVYIEIIFVHIKYQNEFNMKMKWDFNLLKKEKIYQVVESWKATK